VTMGFRSAPEDSESGAPRSVGRAFEGRRVDAEYRGAAGGLRCPGAGAVPGSATTQPRRSAAGNTSDSDLAGVGSHGRIVL